MARFSGLFDDKAFLALVDRLERQLAKVLSVLLCVVLIAATTQLIIEVWREFFNPDTGWLGDDLIRILGDVLTVLIALEVLQNVTAYLRHHVVQIELVLLTALTAVARKVIVLPRLGGQTPSAAGLGDHGGEPVSGLLAGALLHPDGGGDQKKASQIVPGSGSVATTR